MKKKLILTTTIILLVIVSSSTVMGQENENINYVTENELEDYLNDYVKNSKYRELEENYQILKENQNVLENKNAFLKNYLENLEAVLENYRDNQEKLFNRYDKISSNFSELENRQKNFENQMENRLDSEIENVKENAKNEINSFIETNSQKFKIFDNRINQVLESQDNQDNNIAANKAYSEKWKSNLGEWVSDLQDETLNKDRVKLYAVIAAICAVFGSYAVIRIAVSSGHINLTPVGNTEGSIEQKIEGARNELQLMVTNPQDYDRAEMIGKRRELEEYLKDKKVLQGDMKEVELESSFDKLKGKIGKVGNEVREVLEKSREQIQEKINRKSGD